MAGQLRVDEITNEAGTGSPSFPNGVAASTATTAGSITGTTTAAVPTSALGSGTANSTTFLAGDRSFKTVQTGPATGDTLTTTRTLSEPDFLLANGSVYLKSSYTALAALIGEILGPGALQTWTTRTSGFGTSVINSVTFGAGLYVAAGRDGKITTSPDTVTWTSRTSNFGADQIRSVAFLNNLFVAVGGARKISTSTNGTTWTARTSNVTGTFTAVTDVAFGNSLFVAGADSGEITTSPDGTTWTLRTSGFGITGIQGVSFGNGIFVAVGGDGKIASSTDGITWALRTSGTTDGIEKIAFGPNGFIAVTGTGQVLQSNDGINWNNYGFRIDQTSGVIWLSIKFLAGVYIAGGGLGTSNTGHLAYSIDGFQWVTVSKTLPVFYARGITYNQGTFVLVGDSGYLATNPIGYNVTTQFATPQIPISLGATSYIKA
jgi:hypothetical protein